MKLPIYLDYAATTPLDLRVAEKMSRFLTAEGLFANPASAHSRGSEAKKAIEEARMQVAAAIHAQPDEIIWTSGATESNNLALKGAAQLYQQRGKHIVTLKTEHPSVLEPCQQLEKQGFRVTYLAPEKNGLLNLETVRHALNEDTILVSIMQVNNETGVIQDIASIAQLTAERGIVFHVDAAQSIGKVKLDTQHIPVDLISLCAHKVYGPKGIGALYVRRKPRVRVAAQIHGGGQEQGMRSGTLPTHQIVGMGEAFFLAANVLDEENQQTAALKQHFWQGIAAKNVMLNMSFEHTVPHILNVGFTDIEAEAWMKKFPELAVSAGSACHTHKIQPSYVLRACGFSAQEARSSIRFSLGRMTTLNEINAAISLIQSR